MVERRSAKVAAVMLGTGLSSRERSASGLLFAWALQAMGCAQPAADVLAIWVEAAMPEESRRVVAIYDRGAFERIEIEPAIAGVQTDALQLGVDELGSGFAVAGTRQTIYQSLRDRRRLTLHAADVDGRSLARGFEFTRNGDALVRPFADGDPGSFALLPLLGPRAGTPLVVETPEPRGVGLWLWLTAREAPILTGVLTLNGVAPMGPVVVLGYPGEEGGAPTLVELARTDVDGRGPDANGFPARLPPQGCQGRICMDPSGTSITALGLLPCTIVWWRWSEDEFPRTIELPDACPRELDPLLVAHIESDVVVLDDDTRVYVVDLDDETVQSLPKIDDGIRRVGAVDGGHALLIVTPSGQVTRIDAQAPRYVSTEHSACGVFTVDGATFETVVSPNGAWVLQTCQGDGNLLPGGRTLVTRISSLGLDVFDSIAVRPLGIDDDGNALLFSVDPGAPQQDPRGLFVLSADGELARVDDLDPQPDPHLGPDGEQYWFGVR